MFAIRAGTASGYAVGGSGAAHSLPSNKLLRRASSQPCLCSSPTASGSLPSRVLREVTQNSSHANNSTHAAVVLSTPPSLFDLDDADFSSSSSSRGGSASRGRTPIGTTKARAPFDRTNSVVTSDEIAPTQLRALLNSPVPRLLEACKPANAFEQQMAAVVKHLAAAAALTSPRPSSPGSSPSNLASVSNAAIEAIATELLGMGYMVQIRDGSQEQHQERNKAAAAAPTILLSGAHHRFLTCTGCQAPPSHDPTYLTDPLIVELRFREHFVIQFNSATPSYDTLLMAVPNLFIGTLSRLETAVEVLSAEITRAFRLIGRPLPPWRTQKAMVSRWLPEQLRALSKLLAQSSSFGNSGAPTSAWTPAVSAALDGAASAALLLQRAGSMGPAALAPPLPVCPSPRTPPATDGAGHQQQPSDNDTSSGPVSQADLLYYVERGSPTAVGAASILDPEPEAEAVSDPLSRMFSRVLSGDLRALASRSRRCTGALASALRGPGLGSGSRHGYEGEGCLGALEALAATNPGAAAPGPYARSSAPLLPWPDRGAAEASPAAAPTLHQGLVPRLSLDLHQRRQQGSIATVEVHGVPEPQAPPPSAILRPMMHTVHQDPWFRIHKVRLGAQPGP